MAAVLLLDKIASLEKQLEIPSVKNKDFDKEEKILLEDQEIETTDYFHAVTTTRSITIGPFLP